MRVMFKGLFATTFEPFDTLRFVLKMTSVPLKSTGVASDTSNVALDTSDVKF